jgi:TolB-like protein/Tfp pilus assembly protein PilF
MSFWVELRRRNVVKVGAAYAIVAWLLLQIAVNAFPALQLPSWTVTFVTVLLLIGFPIALILAWAYEVTPEGIKPTKQVPVADSITRVTGQKLNYVVTGLLVLAVGYIAADNYLFSDRAPAGASAPVTANGTAGAAGAAAGAAPAQTTSTGPTGTSPGAAEARPIMTNSVAVLPFANMSPNPDDEYFAAGIHEEILNYLAKLKSLSVIGRTTMLRYADTNKSYQEIATELGVETVMEGSVRYAGDRVRVTTQLIDATTGTHLWSEAYERPFEDIFAIQADIAMNVANALNAAFSPEEQRQIEQAPNVSPTTYATYLRVLLDLGGVGNQSPQMFALLDGMIAEAPDFAAPYGIKALIYANLLINTTYGSAGERSEREAQARANAERALALDPNDQAANSALVIIDVLNWRWAEARQTYERYYRAAGRPAAYHHWFTSWTGNDAEAIEIAQRVVELNPGEAGAYWNLGIVSSYARQYDAAADALRRAIGLAPSPPLFHSWLAFAEIGRNNSAEALRELQLVERLLGQNRAIIYLVDMIYSYGRLGRSADVERIFAEIQEIAATQDIGAGGWAMTYLALGEEEKALEQLRIGAQRARDKVLDPGFFQLMNLRVNVIDDPVLEQPEFVEVRAQLTGD